jgi:alginate export protein
MAFIPRARFARRGCLALIAALACQLLFFAGLHPAYGQATDTSTELKRPAYQWMRFNEDWSVLRGRDLSTTGDFWDRLKFIPLTPDGTVYLSLGGQIRERAEYFHNFFFGDSTPEASDAYLLSRFRLSADLHVTDYFRAFVEGRSSWATDRDLTGGATSAYESKFTLQNAFGDIKIPLGGTDSLTVRGGRFEMIYGSQRMISSADFTNVPRTFDGGLGIVRVGPWTITPFWTIPVVTEVDITNFPFHRVSPHQSLFGLFATNAAEYYPPFPLQAPPPRTPFNLDVYWFGVNNAVATFNGTSGREERHTLGGRIWGKIGQTGLDYEVEGAGQFGSVGSHAIAAGMVTTVLGYTVPVPQLAPRVYVEFDYASGDGSRGGTVGTYNQLFPNTHIYLGYIDYIGRQNIISGSGGVSITPLKDLTVSLQHYFFWRASERDALYNKTGAILRPATTNERYVGAETDLLVNYSFTRHILGYAGYSHFFPGDFIRETGKHRESDFLYAAFQYTF